jgi:hypothetical protein
MKNKIPNKPKIKKSVCVVCGKEFSKNRDWQKYCSPQCRKEAFKQRHNIGLKERIDRMERIVNNLKQKLK